MSDTRTPLSGVPYTTPTDADPDDDLTERVRARNAAASEEGTNLSAAEKARLARAAIKDPVTGLIDPNDLPAQEGGELTQDLVDKINMVPAKADQTDLDDEIDARIAGDVASLQKAENLSDLGSVPAARANLGLGTAATQPTTAFDPAGAADAAEAGAIAFATSALSSKIDTTDIGVAGEGGVAGYNDTQTKFAAKLNKENVFQVSAFRALPDATDTSAIQAAVAAAIPVRGIVDFGQGVTWNVTSRLDLPVGSIGYKAAAVTLNCANVPDSDLFAVRFLAGTTDAYIYTQKIEGLRILGPLSQSRNLDGVFFGRATEQSGGNVAGASFWNVHVRGFRDNYFFGNQSWLNSFHHCISSRAWRRGVNVDAQTNAGENYSWYGGAIVDCQNDAGTAVGLYIPKEGNPDVNLFGVSFDYCNLEMSLNSGPSTFVGCHFEDRNAGPQIEVTSTGGFEPSHVRIIGGVFAGTENNTTGVGGDVLIPGGRQSFVNVSGDRSVVLINGASWGRFGQYNSELVTVTSGNPLVSVSHVDPIVNINEAPRISGKTNAINNGDFEGGIGDWKLTSTVNFIRNNAFIGASSGTPGTRPTNWTIPNTTNGLTLQILSIDYSTDRPALTFRISGTPTATGSYTLVPEVAQTIAASAGQFWNFTFGLRAVGVSTGITLVQPAVREKSVGGTTLAAGTTDFNPTLFRRRYSASRTFSNASTAFIEAALLFYYTNGVAVDATYVLDTPMLTLDGDPLTEVVSTNPASAIPTARHFIDTTNFRTGTRSFAMTNTGTGSYALSRTIGVTPGERLLVRSYVQTSAATGGTAGIVVDWLNSSGSVISSTTIGNTQLASGIAFAQRGGCPTVPLGASQARINLRSDGLNGQANFDDIEIWNI